MAAPCSHGICDNRSRSITVRGHHAGWQPPWDACPSQGTDGRRKRLMVEDAPGFHFGDGCRRPRIHYRNHRGMMCGISIHPFMLRLGVATGHGGEAGATGGL